MRKTETFMALATRIGIIADEDAIGVLRKASDGTLCVVRALKSGEFCVINCDGGYARLLKVLPTKERARAYNFAVAAN